MFVKAREGGGCAVIHKSGDLPGQKSSIAFRGKARCLLIGVKKVHIFRKARLSWKSRAFTIFKPKLHIPLNCPAGGHPPGPTF